VGPGQGEADPPPPALDPAVTRLAKQPDRLGPAEDLLHALPLLLTDGIAGMAGRPAIDRTAAVRGVLGHMGRDLALPQGRDKARRVVALVGAERRAGGAGARPGRGGVPPDPAPP